MNLLISWSKAQSKAVASALHGWLPTVVPGIQPWMSSKDIVKGKDWFAELQSVLAGARLCIICVTPENVRSPWIYYETGAIAAKGPDVLICPFLVGVSPNLLADGPLGKWQCTVADKEDSWGLIRSLNLQRVFKFRTIYVSCGAVSNPTMVQVRGAHIEPVMESEVDDEGFVASYADQLAGLNLSSEARTMIVEVSQDEGGMLLYSMTRSGTCSQARQVNLCPDQSPRTVARWKAALDQLVAHDILEPQGYQGEIFVLTARGFEIADSAARSGVKYGGKLA